jgi:phenylalanyl-tRNA synthetase beta chain
MIVSWNWLGDYVALDGTPAEDVTTRLAMAGLNHEATVAFGKDLAIDLEITSNRPDCLGHLGVAREVAVLYAAAFQSPDARPAEAGPDVAEVTQVSLECPQLCPRYTARVIRGVRVGPSPGWLVSRLGAVGVKSINNIVDITNYVMLECGQPLHAFDFDKLDGRRIVVREARAGEQLQAIDHKSYALAPGMIVIGDARTAVGLGGVMGGLETEVGGATTNVLIEAAEFAPLSIRNTARALRLHSPSSYRFERGVDSQWVDWASRRCCQLILELAGGQLCRGVLDVGTPPEPRGAITLRYAQLPRVLGIDVPVDEVRRILKALGCRESQSTSDALTLIPPSWRRDLAREIDLVEEIARIHGYDKIPEDVSVPMSPSHRSDADRLSAQVRRSLTAAGFDEAITISATPEDWCKLFAAWSDSAPLRCATPVVKDADCLRQSLLPSLLGVRAGNESVANETIELFETAKVYLPQPDGLPREPKLLALSSGRDFYDVKGVLESTLDALHVQQRLRVEAYRNDFFLPGQGCRLRLGDDIFGYLGATSQRVNKFFGLRRSSLVAELDLNVLLKHATLVPQYAPLVPYPAINQDLNIVVQERVRWADLEQTVWAQGGEHLEAVTYREIYRDAKTDGPGTKRLLFTITLRSSSGTLTGEQAGETRQRIVDAVAKEHAGRLLG